MSFLASNDESSANNTNSNQSHNMPTFMFDPLDSVASNSYSPETSAKSPVAGMLQPVSHQLNLFDLSEYPDTSYTLPSIHSNLEEPTRPQDTSFDPANFPDTSFSLPTPHQGNLVNHSNEFYQNTQCNNESTSGPVTSHVDHSNTLDMETRLRNLEKSSRFLLKENEKLKREIKLIKKDVDHSFDSIFFLERDLYDTQQYNRRESIEISGIPKNVPQHELEDRMIDLLRRIGLSELNSYCIAACHRLKRNNNIIIRFTNRKWSYDALFNKKLLKTRATHFPNAWIHESLCPAYRKIYNIGNELKKAGEIRFLWTYDGKILFKYGENDRPKRIAHLSEFDHYFDEWERFLT